MHNNTSDLYAGKKRKDRENFFDQQFEIDAHRKSHRKDQQKILPDLIRAFCFADGTDKADGNAQHRYRDHNIQTAFERTVDQEFESRADAEAYDGKCDGAAPAFLWTQGEG